MTWKIFRFSLFCYFALYRFPERASHKKTETRFVVLCFLSSFSSYTMDSDVKPLRFNLITTAKCPKAQPIIEIKLMNSVIGRQ